MTLSFKIEPDTIAHYKLEHLLARGGMSLVYLARDIQTGQQVAIKLVHASEHDYYERFQREAKTLANLENEHILPIFDYGEYESWFYMAMPYIEDGSLRDRMAKGMLPLEEAEAILTQLVAAVQYAHDRGIVHRDIKPSNILLRDGKHVYLADFGLVKNADEISDLTQTGCLLGTPEYMAPELAERPATVSSDIYALGVIFYYMLTGHMPFKSSTPLGIYWKHLHEQPVAPSMYNQALSLATDQVLLHALAREPEQRFQSAKALLKAYQVSKKPEQVSISIVPVRTLPSTVTRQPVVSPPGGMRGFFHSAMNMRVGALLVLAATLLFIVPALLHLSLTYGYDRSQASIVEANSLSFHNHPLTTTPVVQPTSTNHPTPTVSKPPIQRTTKVSFSSSSNNKNGSNSQRHDSGGGKGKHNKHKHKHGNGD